MSRPLARPLAAALGALLLLLGGAGVALADNLDPRRQITPGDQAKARSMLLRKSDLGPGVGTQPSSPEAHLTCGDLSFRDLTITGDATSPTFIAGTAVVASSAELYASAADSRASWRRSAGKAGVACAASLLRREYGKQGLELVSFGKRPFPRVGQGTVAFTAELSGEMQGLTVELTLGVIALLHSRAQASIVWGSVFPLTRAEELRLARLVSNRMAVALRG